MDDKSACEQEPPPRAREKHKISSWFTFMSSGSSNSSAKPPKSEKNIFQRMKKKLEKKLPGYRFKCDHSSSERPPEMGLGQIAVMKGSIQEDACNDVDSEEGEMESDSRRKLLKKKWLGSGSPNAVMYKACMEMLSYAWYWGEISRHEAQRQLTDKPNGSFLIRDSEKDGSQFTLSFRMWNRTLHYRIQFHDNYWHFETRKYESMVEMVENVMNRSDHEMFFVQRTSDIMPPFPVILRYPLSRYLNFTTLQELCRRVINKNMDESDIRSLPIPGQLKKFLIDNDGSGSDGNCVELVPVV